jgi:protein-tyrosine-phosphatase
VTEGYAGPVEPRDPDSLISSMRERAAELEAGLDESEQARPAPNTEFELVLVCTGNRVRSPIAEAFLRELLADLPVRLRSLGTLDLGEVPPLPEAMEAAAAHGLDIAGHRARTLYADDLGTADLVIGFESRHTAAAVVDAGARRDRTFSLPELVDLLDEPNRQGFVDPLERARHVIAAADSRRGEHAGARAAELADPLGQDRNFYRTTVERIRELSERLAEGLFGQETLRPLSVPTNAPARSERGLRRGWSRGR